MPPARPPIAPEAIMVARKIGAGSMPTARLKRGLRPTRRDRRPPTAKQLQIPYSMTRARLMMNPRTPFCLSSGNLGSFDFSAALSDERENLSGEIALQGSNGVEFGMPFRDPASNIVLGSLIG